MDVKSVTIDNKLKPIALTRSSVRMMREHNSTQATNEYTNIDSHHDNSQPSRIKLSQSSSFKTLNPPKPIKLVVSSKPQDNEIFCNKNLKNGLSELIAEKDKQIRDLEKLVEDQKRLRLQDATQVEEKAARIKEWVANKLKELENQNKHLRDQNKKQKETIESLSKQLSTLNSNFSSRDRCESPIYDSVTIEQINRKNFKNQEAIKNPNDINLSCSTPPQPPLHQSDRWELELYDLAEQSFSTLIKKAEDKTTSDSQSQLDSIESYSNSNSDKEASISRTQSVRRNPAPERLYDFITSDLVKRGYLIKPGALKNHNRWFVLKNFHLYSYKNETDEAAKATPNVILRLNLGCQVCATNQSGESNFPFKISYLDKNWHFVAESITVRDSWIRILTVAINMSDLEADTLTMNNAIYNSLMSVTRNGHTKRCYGTLVNHIIFFLKSPTDPTPISYFSMKGAKIREITDNYDYDMEENQLLTQKRSFQDCSLAIYPKYSLNLDPVYLTLAGQQETDKWFYFLSSGSGVDQSYGTHFERSLREIMINNSLTSKDITKECSILLYSSRPISEPLTNLSNETLRMDAVELFKSILLIIQVPIEPVAIDYHVSLMQNCYDRFLKYPELRNEFFAQLIKQCNYGIEHTNDFLPEDFKPPSPGELTQVMQILAIVVSLNLPRGRMRWWLINYLRKLGNLETIIGKYALYTLRAIDRTIANGPRENVPSRTEIMSILLRNPYDHSSPHSLPVNFSDGTYLVVEADGSTTIEEFMLAMIKNINIRQSQISDFYLFADDPTGLTDLYILEPQRKVLDIVGWWEQMFRRQKSGRFQSTKSIKLTCKKRLILRAEDDETHQERFLIVHQINQEVVSQRIPMSENLALELAALMAQLTYGDYEKSKDPKLIKCILEKVYANFLPNNKSSHSDHSDHQNTDMSREYRNELITRWLHLSGKSAQECIRVYLNCIRRLKLTNYN